MARVRRPPEWGVEPVPQGLRILRTFDLFVLWSSLGIGLLVLAAGTLLIGVGGFGFGLTLAESALVALVGSVVGSLMLAAAAHHGSRAGVPTMVSLRPILGRRGSYVATALNVFQLLGWAAFELLVMGIAAATLVGDVFGPPTATLFVPIFGAVVAAPAPRGPPAVIPARLGRFSILPRSGSPSVSRISGRSSACWASGRFPSSSSSSTRRTTPSRTSTRPRSQSRISHRRDAS